MSSFLSMRFEVFYFSLCQILLHSQSILQLTTPVQTKVNWRGPTAVHLVEGGCHFRIIAVLPIPLPSQHLFVHMQDRSTAISCWMGSRQDAVKGLCRSLPGWSTPGRAQSQAYLGMFLPPPCPRSFLIISHAQSSSHTIFRSCFFHGRKQVIWRLHYIYLEKRALEMKYTHCKHAVFAKVHHHSLNLIFHLGKEKRISCGFFLKCTSCLTRILQGNHCD